ncbi:MAG TPA: metal ABC transporter substrate-binding protein [Candidatus Acidoferrum sp.]|nr:metal ABC transporter substrate-binding protein [Candidatus Acidoferrum sp.]
MRKILLVALTLWSATATAPWAKVKVVASSTDLASIAREVGGALVDVNSIGQGKSNLHFVEMLPSYMLQVSKADLYLKIGLAMDQWADGIIDGSRNDKLTVVDCSKGIDVLEKPSGKVDASMGDVHPDGNPHYWLDPRNGKIIADNILEGLTKVDPGDAATYKANRDAFEARLDQKWQEWSNVASAFKGLPIVSYHSTFVYFAHAFGIDVIGYVEPKPGIEPTASHTAELIDLMKQRQVHVIFREPYYSERAPQAIAKETGAIVYTAPSSVGGTDDAKDYVSLFDTLVGILKQATENRP